MIFVRSLSGLSNVVAGLLYQEKSESIGNIWQYYVAIIVFSVNLLLDSMAFVIYLKLFIWLIEMKIEHFTGSNR